MIEFPTPQTIPAADAVPWVLGHQLQPHRGRWLYRRARPGPWVFLGLRGLLPEGRMQGLRGGDETEMPWPVRPGPDGPGGPDGRPRRERPGPTGPMGPQGPAGRDGRADRTPAGPLAGTGAPVAAPEPPAIHPPIGMFIFQQAAGLGPLPHPARSAASLAGIFAGRTGGMTSGTVGLAPLHSGGLTHLSSAGDISGRPVSIPVPSKRNAEISEAAEDGLSTRPHPLPEAIPQPAAVTRADGIYRAGQDSARSGGPAGQLSPGSGAFAHDAERVRPTRPAHTPGLGVLSSIVSLLPGIGRRPRPDADRRPALPEGGGFPVRGLGDRGQDALTPLREPDPGAALPVRSAGRVPPGGSRTGISGLADRLGSLTDPAGSLHRDDLPLPVAHPRGKEMGVMVSAIEQAVARHVDKALKDRLRPPPPGRPAPEPPAPAPDIESDRVARRLASRIRRLAQDDRFRRGQLR
jgi:hypothetical protein